MGASASKSVREAPVRYAAKQLPRLDSVPIEQKFKKPQLTAQGINRRQDDVNTEPLMYVETARDGTSTEVTDHTAPRWYLNTYMEMLDNVRTDQIIISGNLPISWERDKFEPYALVQGRIDDEDLQWVLDPEQRKKGVDALVESTKLSREVLQDILDTVEVPRVQYRNYKGKLHKSIEDSNVYATARKKQVERARELEILREIGYSDEEMEREDQYLTQRTRGVKALDSLGASRREKKRLERSCEASDMEDMLEERKIEMLEQGKYELTDEDIYDKPGLLSMRPKHHASYRKGGGRKVYAGDFGKRETDYAKFHWWLDRSRRVKRAVDSIHGVPIYNERLSANEEQNRKQMKEAAEFNFAVSRAQGAKGFTDPRGHYDQFMEMIRQNHEEEKSNPPTVNIYEDGVTQHAVFSYPHTASHSPHPTEVVSEERFDKAEPLDTNIQEVLQDLTSEKIVGTPDEPTKEVPKKPEDGSHNQRTPPSS